MINRHRSRKIFKNKNQITNKILNNLNSKKKKDHNQQIYKLKWMSLTIGFQNQEKISCKKQDLHKV
jgi:hypothetical protein